MQGRDLMKRQSTPHNTTGKDTCLDYGPDYATEVVSKASEYIHIHYV